MTNATALGGHVTFLLGDECYTFEMPRFTDTRVVGWAPGAEGEYHRIPWSDGEIAAWIGRRDAHGRLAVRYGWVRRLRLRAVPRRVEWWDDDGERVSQVEWQHLGDWLHDRLVPRRPGPTGHHLVTMNTYDRVHVIGTDGVAFTDNWCQVYGQPQSG